MPIPSSLTLDYGALLSTTLFNYKRTMEDNIATGNAAFYMMKKKDGGWSEVSDLGERYACPLMHEIGAALPYNGYDVISLSPMDGITTAFYDWRQLAIPVMISRRELRQNSGEARLINLMESKVKQAEIGFIQTFNRAFLQGNGINSATAVTTPYTNPNNAALAFEPIAQMVRYDPTASTTIGNINQNTYTFWRNQFLADASTTYAGFLKNLRKLYNNCSKGSVGGGPNCHIVDQNTYELYEAALSNAHRNPSYTKADIPFDNIAFRGGPVTWDEYVIDAAGGTTVQSTTSGSWYMLNLKFMGFRVDSETNFTPTEKQKPANQDAVSQIILWMGLMATSNRRKHGVMGSIDSTIAS